MTTGSFNWLVKITSKPLWNLGFRPFFLLGSLSGTISLGIWLLSLQGYSYSHSIDQFWHAHEMIFGFVLAIIVGFLLTASQNWSGKTGVHGGSLIALVLIWGIGRLLLISPFAGTTIAAVLDLFFIPFTVFLLLPYIKDQKKNWGFLVLLSLLWLCNIGYHLSDLGVISDVKRKSLLIAIQIILIVVVVIVGRVLPFFTKSAIRTYRRKNLGHLDRLALLVSVLFAGVYSYSEYSMGTWVLGYIAAAVHLVRLGLWFDILILKKPILLILYIGYLWLIVGYYTSAMAAQGQLIPSIAIHAFTVGTMSVLIIGMMSRVSLGHTGRKIFASRLCILGYGCILTSAVVRFLGPLLQDVEYMQSITLAGGLWMASALLFVWEYARVLLKAREDGKPG